MSKVIISREEYKKLKNQSEAYKKIATRLFEVVIKDQIEEVVSDFRQTNLYTKGFLSDLDNGLRKSSYSSR